MVTYAQGEFHLKKVRFLMLIIITFCLVINMTACSKEKTDNYNDANILGRWVETYGDQELIFFEDGTYSEGISGNYQNGTYSISSTVLRLIDSTGITEIYDCVLDGDTLTLTLEDTKKTYLRQRKEDSTTPTSTSSLPSESDLESFAEEPSELSNATAIIAEEQLLGKWISEDNQETWEFTGNGECNYADALATGFEYYTFALEANIITLKPISGNTTTRIICSLEDATLTLTTETGDTSVFYKCEDSPEERIVGTWLADIDGQQLTFFSNEQLEIYSAEMLNIPQYKLTYDIDNTILSIYSPTGITYLAEYTLKADRLTLTTENWGAKTYRKVSEILEPFISSNYTSQSTTSDKKTILGHWVCIDGTSTHEMFFFEDGTVSSGTNGNLYSFNWSLLDGFLQMSSPTGESQVLQYELTNNSLTLFDNSQTMVFQKQDD